MVFNGSDFISELSPFSAKIQISWVFFWQKLALCKSEIVHEMVFRNLFSNSWGQIWKRAKPCKRGWAQKALVSFWQNWWDSMNLFKMLMHVKWWFECEITFFTFQFSLHHCGGFQLEFVSIRQVINHMPCYKFECSHWWKIYLKKEILYKICSPVWML